jgi:hypothetical protein
MQAASLQSRNERRRAPNLSFLDPIDLTCKSPDCRSAGDPPRAAWDPSPWVGGTPRQGPGGLLRKFAKSALRLAIGGSDGRRGSGWAMPAGGPWSDRIGDRPPTRVRARGVSVWEGGLRWSSLGCMLGAGRAMATNLVPARRPPPKDAPGPNPARAPTGVQSALRNPIPRVKLPKFSAALARFHLRRGAGWPRVGRRAPVC